MTEIKKNLTPMFKQYWSIKDSYKETILFFRMGDFYEMFYDDAKIVAKELGLTLTSRHKNDAVPMCGFPYHSLSQYLGKMLEKGYKIAICEQVEDPKLAKGIVKREVVKVFTPGINLEEEIIFTGKENFLLSVCPVKEQFSITITEFSTGEIEVGLLRNIDELKEEILRLTPKEVLLPFSYEDEFIAILNSIDIDTAVTPLRDYYFDAVSEEEIKNFFGVVTLEGYGIKDKKIIPSLIGALNYIKETQKGVTKHLKQPRLYLRDNFLYIDESTKRNLEIFYTNRDGSKEGALWGVINNTKTPMGRRLLARWLNFPLIDVNDIRKRQLFVSSFLEEMELRLKLREYLARVYDIERLISRIIVGTGTPRDIAKIRDSLLPVMEIKEFIDLSTNEYISSVGKEIEDISPLYSYLNNALIDNPPIIMKDGGIVKEGFSDELDDLRNIKERAKEFFDNFVEREREKTGIPNLKIGFNKVFGYFVEISKSYLEKVPDDYIRKQTLVGGERFITSELKEWEDKILTASERANELEYKIFAEIRDMVVSYGRVIQDIAGKLAFLDVLSSFAQLAEEKNFVLPSVIENKTIEIKEGRHPVIEELSKTDRFVPNDLILDYDNEQIVILTGPNMAGKSTYLRQNALIILLAQIGSFVPATEAKIGVVDRIYSRVGASDNISKGLSTFMVEMVETANILHNATERSFIILDEIGRGTSTFDGISIAWAAVEYLHDFIGAKTIFATHYHELIDLEKIKRRVINFNMQIKQRNDEIVFLRKVNKGGSSHSYGIDVAKLAGLPDELIERAREILVDLEMNENNNVKVIADGQYPRQLNLFYDSIDDFSNKLLKELKKIDVNKITPVKALNLLYKWKEKLEDENKKN